MPGLMPESPRHAKQRKRGLVVCATFGGLIDVRSLYSSLPSPHALVGLTLLLAANAGIVWYAWPATDGFLVRPARRGRKGIPRGHGRDGGAGLAPPVSGPWPGTGRWPVLRAVSRLMPRAAGRRWLAEAESLLFEVPAGWRRTVVRSYLRSAPRLVLAMWAAEFSRWARRRIRRR